MGERIEAFSILKGAILVVNCAALRENLDRVQNAKMQIARADLSLRRGGAGGVFGVQSAWTMARARDRIVFLWLGRWALGVAWADSRESLGRAGLARLAWARGVGELGRGLW